MGEIGNLKLSRVSLDLVWAIALVDGYVSPEDLIRDAIDQYLERRLNDPNLSEQIKIIQEKRAAMAACVLNRTPL